MKVAVLAVQGAFIEHRKKLVPVLAASWAEAEERVREMWENGEVVIGQSDFTGIMISSGG